MIDLHRWSHLLIKLTTKSDPVYSSAFSFGFAFMFFCKPNKHLRKTVITLTGSMKVK